MSNLSTPAAFIVDHEQQCRVSMMSKPGYLLILLLLFPTVSFTNEDVQPETDVQEIDLPALIKQCEGCHGPKGHSTRDDIPSLAGKPISLIEEYMAQFYYFERHCPGKKPQTESGEGSAISMCSIASTLSDAEVLALAQYFSTQ